MDEALKALIEIYEEQDLDISVDLLKKCYEIEKKYQFETDNALSVNDLQTAVTIAVEKDGEES